MKLYKTGLVVGKFSPLHLGHELLVGRALDACDTTIIISYSVPELPGCEPARREQWLRARFPSALVLVVDASKHSLPHNDASAIFHRRFVAQLCLDTFGTPVDAVFTSEDYGDGFAEELERHFTTRLGAQYQVRHVCVDQARKLVPVSGTLVRSNPHRHRAWLSPEVYASFVQTVCFLGGESSGKTTMAEQMACRFGSMWVPEYGRELWASKGGVLEYEDMEQIARVQLRREDSTRIAANRFLFCDTSCLTTLFYAQEMFGHANQSLELMAARSYDYVFLCAPDFEFVQDGTRRKPEFRLMQHDWYVAELAKRRIAYTLLAGPIERRVAAAAAILVDRAAHNGAPAACIEQ